MQKNINLSIPAPCSEKWENFTTTSRGGFCSSCNKTVIDFTSKSDDEVLNFFKNKPEHACGRFRPGQLKTYSLSPVVQINPGYALFKAGLISLLLLLISRPATAQVETKKPTVGVVDSIRTNLPNSRATESFTVKGVVLDGYDNSTIPGVNILLKGTVRGMISDSEGKFEFHDLKEGDVLVFCFIGLVTKEYRVKKQPNTTLVQMAMVEMEMDITGEVAVHEIYEPRTSGVQRIWWKLKGLF